MLVTVCPVLLFWGCEFHAGNSYWGVSLFSVFLFRVTLTWVVVRRHQPPPRERGWWPGIFPGLLGCSKGARAPAHPPLRLFSRLPWTSTGTCVMAPIIFGSFRSKNDGAITHVQASRPWQPLPPGPTHVEVSRSRGPVFQRCMLTMLGQPTNDTLLCK